VWPHKGSRTPSKEPLTCATERLGLRWCQGSPGIPWTFWQPGPASAQSPEPAYRQLGLREYFETLPARSTVKVAELLMGARVDIEALAIRRFCL
jgi:hypothetical protein